MRLVERNLNDCDCIRLLSHTVAEATDALMDTRLHIQRGHSQLDCVDSVAPQPVTRARRSRQRKPDYLAFGRAEFNKRRKLFIQNVPPVTHQDVREMMGTFIPADIVISRRLQHVIITLKHSDQVDLALQSLNNKLLAGCPVHVELYPRRMMLYICGLPRHYSDDMFRDFLACYGEVETAFLSLSSRGESNGYGFVEFAHNRATLEKVQQTLNGYLLDNHILYCGLVSESVRTFEDTQSKTLFCVVRKEDGLTGSQLREFGQSTISFDLSAGRKLHVLECTDADAAERVCYKCSHGDLTEEPRLLYAMPAVPADQLPAIVGDVQRKSERTEMASLVHMLFSDQPQVAMAMERLLSTSEFQGRAPTISMIMELANRVQTPASNLQTPMTSQNLTASSVVGELVPPPGLPIINRPPDEVISHPNDLSFNMLREIKGRYAGPVTRSRLRTFYGDQGGSGHPTDMVDSKYKVKDIGAANQQTGGRKRRNSGRDKVSGVSEGWSIWDGIPGTGGLKSTSLLSPGETYRNKENSTHSNVCSLPNDNAEPLSKRPFRRTPGAEKRERRLRLQASKVNESWQGSPLVRQVNVHDKQTPYG